MALTSPPPLGPFSQFTAAIRGWWRAFGYMSQHRLRTFHLAGPAAILAITVAGLGLTGWLTRTIQEGLDRGLRTIGLDLDNMTASPDAWWTDTLLWGASRLDWALEWVVALLVLWLKVKVTKYLLLTLMAPFMSALAGRVREVETGTSLPFTPSQLLRDLLRGLRTAASLLAAELTLTLALSLLGLLLTVFAAPLAVLLSPILIAIGWLVGVYFYGAAIFDAVHEQSGLDWRSSIRQGWQDRFSLVGIGTVFSLLIAVPFIGVFLAAFLGPMPCTVAAARLTFTPTP